MNEFFKDNFKCSLGKEMYALSRLFGIKRFWAKKCIVLSIVRAKFGLFLAFYIAFKRKPFFGIKALLNCSSFLLNFYNCQIFLFCSVSATLAASGANIPESMAKPPPLSKRLGRHFQNLFQSSTGLRNRMEVFLCFWLHLIKNNEKWNIVLLYRGWFLL